MNIRAKFKCTSVQKFEGATEVVSFSAVTSGSDDNKQWSRFTPAGQLSMTISVEGAVGQFTPGTEYFLDIAPAT